MEQIEKIESKSVTKNIAWNSVGSIFYCGCQWLITIIVVYLSSYESAGYLSLAMTTSSSFSAISMFCMRNYQVSDVTGEYTQDEYVGSRILTCLLAMFSCTLTAFFTNTTYQAMCIAAFMLVRVAEAMVDVFHGIDQKYDRYDYIGKSFILRGMVTVVSFTLGLLFIKELMVTLFLMACLNLGCMLLFDMVRTNRLLQVHPIVISRRVLLLLKTCVPIVIYAFLMSLENLIPKNILQDLYGTDVLGIYSTIASPTLVVQVFAQVAFNPLLPKLSYVYNIRDFKGFLKQLRMVYIALLGLAVVVWLGALFLGRWALGLILPEDILQYYDLFMPIVFCTIETAFIWVLVAIVTAIRKNRWLLIGMGVDFIILCCIAKPCIEAYGANGVSVAQMIVYAIYIIFLVFVCELTVAQQKKVENK